MLTKIVKKEPVFFNEKVEIFKIKESAKYKKLRKKIEEGLFLKILKFFHLINKEQEKKRVKKLFEEIKSLAYFKSKKKNTVAMVGRARIMKVLAAEANISTKDTNAETFPNVCAIGTDDTAHTENSTTLYTETFRKLLSSRQSEDNKLKAFSHYYPADCDGNFREEAIFMDADDETADDGVLLSVVSLSAAEGNKTSSDGLIVERTFILAIA